MLIGVILTFFIFEGFIHSTITIVVLEVANILGGNGCIAYPARSSLTYRLS